MAGRSKRWQEEIQAKLEALRTDYKVVHGKPFVHFFCPILLKDEPSDLCLGHIVNQGLPGGSNETLPQRTDVDNFFGSAVEADFVTVIRDRGKLLAEILFDENLYRVHRPKFIYEGTELEHYVSDEIVPGEHTKLEVRNEAAGKQFKAAIKASPASLAAMDGKTVHAVIDKDYSAPAIASLIKAAHLSLFHLLGYSYVRTAGGLYVADILRKFFTHNKGNHNNAKRDVARYFAPYSNMVRPFYGLPDSIRGTIKDGKVFACMGGSGRPWAIGVIIRTGADCHCVFTPNDDVDSISTFDGFLRQPPASIVLREAHYAKDAEGGKWGVSVDERRTPFPPPFPD